MLIHYQECNLLVAGQEIPYCLFLFDVPYVSVATRSLELSFLLTTNGKYLRPSNTGVIFVQLVAQQRFVEG